MDISDLFEYIWALIKFYSELDKEDQEKYLNTLRKLIYNKLKSWVDEYCPEEE